MSGSSLSHHHSDELFVVDVTVTVDIGLSDHFIDLLIGELLAKVSHHMAQLRGGDETVAVFVEDAERLLARSANMSLSTEGGSTSDLASLQLLTRARGSALYFWGSVHPLIVKYTFPTDNIGNPASSRK